MADRLKNDQSDRSVVFCRVRKNESSEPRTRFKNAMGLIKELLNQIIPKDISRVTLLKVYRLGSQMNLKQNQTRLSNVVLKSPNERGLILQNGYKLKG